MGLRHKKSSRRFWNPTETQQAFVIVVFNCLNSQTRKKTRLRLHRALFTRLALEHSRPFLSENHFVFSLPSICDAIQSVFLARTRREESDVRFNIISISCVCVHLIKWIEQWKKKRFVNLGYWYPVFITRRCYQWIPRHVKVLKDL